MRVSPDRDGAGSDIDAAFEDRAFAPLKARGAAFVVVRPDTAEVLWANAAAAAHWRAPDAGALAETLFGAGASGGWLEGLAEGVVPGRPSRLARAGSARGLRMRARTALVRAWVDGGSLLLALASPDAATAAAAEPDAWRRPAWDGEPVPAGSTSEPGEAPAEVPAGAEDLGEALASRSQVAVLRDRLNQAVDGAAAVRLLWRTDADDAVTQIDLDTFARLASPLRFDGATLPDAVAAHDPDGAALLRAALATRATWSGVTVDLLVADAVATVPMVLGASPVFGPDRRFTGFRGFGTLDLGRLALSRTRKAVAKERVPAETPESAPGPEAAPETAAPTEAVDAAPQAPEPAPAPANVVDLRAFQALASARGPSQPPFPVQAEAVEAAGDDDRAADASPSPELAFLMLGEALRARIGAMASGPEASIPEAPDAAPALGEQPASADTADGPEAAVLGRLPVALAITVGAAPVFANAAAAARLGAASPAALLEETDIVAEPAGGDGGGGLRDARGQPIPARAAAITWKGTPATAWVVDDPDGAGRGRRPARTAADDVGAGELLDRVADAVALLDASGNIRRLNRRGEDWFGAAPLGRSFSLLLSPESRPAALALLDEVRLQRDGQAAPPLQREVLARTGGAEPAVLLLTLGRLGLAGFYATLRDAAPSERAKVAQERADRHGPRDAARLANLLGKVSHEVRTPLNAILGFAEVMMDERFGPLGNPRYRDYLKDIHMSGTQVMTLVEDLLDLSRIEAGQLELAVAPVDVNRIVAETVAQMQAEAHRERVIMRTSLGGRVPSVLADERSARQIVRNLLSNAVKFNEPGGQVIVSTALSDDGTVVLRVRDTGVGMTDEEIAAALEPFGGVAASQPAKAGSNGLGLPLTRALVGANGASMAIRSRPREGTLVEVAFAAGGLEDGKRVPA